MKLYYGLVRGKRLDNGEWVEGFLQRTKEGGCRVVKTDSMIGDFEVDSDTVGEFTGLHDKDGKKIYDGDIVEERLSYSNTNGPYLIKKDIGGFFFASIDKDGIVDDFWTFILDHEFGLLIEKLKVVGNIYK